jgi:hypothetical protein
MRRKGDANKPEDIVMVPMHKGRSTRWLTADCSNTLPKQKTDIGIYSDILS